MGKVGIVAGELAMSGAVDRGATCSPAMKTIIGFDSWTEGSQHFERLVPALEQRGYRLLLIHIGSWGHDADRPAEERIGRLLVRDISYYGTKSFAEILREEAPSAVLFLSMRAFAHMAFNRYARHMGIPTCHLYHGILGVQAFAANSTDLHTSLMSRLAMVRQRIGKNLTRLLPAYARSLRETRAPLRVWKEFATECVSKFRYIHSTDRVTDLGTDIGCVYIEADAGHMAKVYGVPPDRIYAVGNPDISSFGLAGSDLLSCRSESVREDAEILYIETALLEVGAVFANEDDFVRHLVHCREVVTTAGYRLVLKLHPATQRGGVSARLEELGFLLCGRDEFVPRLKRAAAAIAEPSSAALIPALLGLPLLLCQLGQLSRQNYGSVLTSYPSSRFLRDRFDLAMLLSDIRTGQNDDLLDAWLASHSGPMPPDEMPDRVAGHLDHLISTRQSASNISI